MRSRIASVLALMLCVALPATAARAQTCAAPFPIACNERQLAITDCPFSDETSYSCNPLSYPGADQVWAFASTPGLEFWVDLIPRPTGLQPTSNLDLLMNKGTCPFGICAAFSANTGPTTEEQIPAFVGDGSTYLISVDDSGPWCAVEYVLQVACPTPCSVPADLAGTLTCSADLTAQTTAGSSDALDYYACGSPNGPLLQTGPEDIYAFTPQASGIVTVLIENMTTDHDLYVLEQLCDQSACVASTNWAGTVDDAVTFSAALGATYYVVVESPGGAGSYDLRFADATGGCQEDCDDTVDNDGDGPVDCADPDCSADPVCAPAPVPTVPPVGLLVLLVALLCAGAGSAILRTR